MLKIIQKIRFLPRGAKASIAFFVASLMTKGIAYLTTPFYTRLLTTEEFGQVSVYLTWVQLFGIVAMFSFMNGVFNNGMVDYPDKRDEYSFSILILSNIITIVFSIFLFLLYPLLKTLIKMDLPLVGLMCVIFFFQPAQSFWMARQRYEFRYKAVVFVSIISVLLSSLSAILCLLFINKNGVYERLFGAEIVLICFYVFFYILLAHKSKWKINTKYWKFALLFNLPLIPHYLSSFLLSSSDKLMISSMVGDSQAGFYSVAVSIASLATIVWTAINSSLVPYTYEKCKQNDYKSISKVATPLLMAFAFGCLMVIMLAPEAIKLMSTHDYYEAVYIIPPLVGGVFFQVQYYLFANIVYYHKKPIYVMIASLVATSLNIILNFILIKAFGYLAAAYTTIVSYAVQAIIDYVAMKKVVHESVYNMRIMVVLSICVIAISLSSVFLYQFPIVRYGIIGLIVFLLFDSRKRIIPIFSSLK